MSIQANVSSPPQIAATVGETQIAVSVSGGVGPTGPAGAAGPAGSAGVTSLQGLEGVLTLAAVGGTWAASGQTLTLTVTSASVGWADVTGKPSFATVATSGSYNDLGNVPSEFTPAAHNQAWSTITSTPTTLSGYGITDAVASNDARLTDARTPTAHKTSHATGGSDALTAADIGAATASHTHAISDVTSLQTTLDGKASSTHTHAISDVTGLQTALDGKASSTHTHAASDITSGTLAIDRIPTGTTSATVCIGDDARLTDSRTPTAHKTSHATGGSDALTASDIGAAAASHTHAISDVTDLQTSLDAKVASITTGITGADAVTNIVSLTQAEYDAISVKNASTLYIIT